MKVTKFEELEISLNQLILESLTENILVTYNGKPRVLIIGLDSEEDDIEELFLENDRRFLNIIERARRDFQEGKWVELDSLPD